MGHGAGVGVSQSNSLLGEKQKQVATLKTLLWGSWSYGKKIREAQQRLSPAARGALSRLARCRSQLGRSGRRARPAFSPDLSAVHRGFMESYCLKGDPSPHSNAKRQKEAWEGFLGFWPRACPSGQGGEGGQAPWSQREKLGVP